MGLFKTDIEPTMKWMKEHDYRVFAAHKRVTHWPSHRRVA